MATKKWRGDYPATAQESRATPANVEIGDIFTLTINGKSVSFTATAATVANVTAGLTTAWNNSTIPEFAEVTASDQTTYVKLLADTTGKPFTVTSSTTDGGGANTQTLTITTPTAATGPNHYDQAANWTPSGVPTTGDDVYIEDSTVDILYGIDQNTVTLTSLNIAASYTGKIGLPDRNSGGYFEYRQQNLKVGATTVNIGQGPGTGSTRIRLDGDTDATTVNVFLTDAVLNGEAVYWKGVNASNVVNVFKGSVAIGTAAGDTATVPTLRVGYLNNQNSDATVRVSSGVTLTTINQSGGSLNINSNVTTVNQTGGTLTVNGSATVTTGNIDGGTLNYQSTGTVTTLNVGSGAKVDFTRDMRTRTVTTCNLFGQGTILDSFKTVTWTNGIDLERAAIGEVTLDIGTHVKVTPGTPA